MRDDVDDYENKVDNGDGAEDNEEDLKDPTNIGALDDSQHTQTLRQTQPLLKECLLGIDKLVEYAKEEAKEVVFFVQQL